MYGSRTLEIELIIALAKGFRWFSVISISIIRSFSIKEPGDLRERENIEFLMLLKYNSEKLIENKNINIEHIINNAHNHFK